MKKNNFDEQNTSFFEADSVVKKKNKTTQLSIKAKHKTHSAKAEKKDTLAGKCLVYIGNSDNELYNQSVIFITECTENLVRGIMINKLLFGTAALECHQKSNADEGIIKQIYEDLYQGGPENPAHGYVLFPKDEKNDEDPFAEIHGDVAVSTSFGVLQDILDGEGPKKKIIAMGHCVWHRGELEWQIFNNQWLIIPSDLRIMFDTSLEERWLKAKEMSGVSLETFIPQIGLA